MASNGRRKSQDGQGPLDVARAAAGALAQLTGRHPETVLGLRREDDGWRVTLELVELSRIPNSTDVLGTYVVSIDDDGELVGYERVGRHQRGETGGGEA